VRRPAHTERVQRGLELLTKPMMVEVLWGVAADDEHEFTLKQIQEARAAESWITQMGRWTLWKKRERRLRARHS
jgi:hypothetical protein